MVNLPVELHIVLMFFIGFHRKVKVKVVLFYTYSLI